MTTYWSRFVRILDLNCVSITPRPAFEVMLCLLAFYLSHVEGKFWNPGHLSKFTRLSSYLILFHFNIKIHHYLENRRLSTLDRRP